MRSRDEVVKTYNRWMLNKDAASQKGTPYALKDYHFACGWIAALEWMLLNNQQPTDEKK